MLSNQCDELRTLADKLRSVQPVAGADYVMSVEWLYQSIVAMHEAADTIENLLGRLQDAEGARYDAGFDNGVKAVLQQLDGLIHEGAGVGEIQGWIDCQWEEEA